MSNCPAAVHCLSVLWHIQGHDEHVTLPCNGVQCCRHENKLQAQNITQAQNVMHCWQGMLVMPLVVQLELCMHWLVSVFVAA